MCILGQAVLCIKGQQGIDLSPVFHSPNHEPWHRAVSVFKRCLSRITSSHTMSQQWLWYTFLLSVWPAVLILVIGSLWREEQMSNSVIPSMLRHQLRMHLISKWVTSSTVHRQTENIGALMDSSTPEYTLFGVEITFVV